MKLMHLHVSLSVCLRHFHQGVVKHKNDFVASDNVPDHIIWRYHLYISGQTLHFIFETCLINHLPDSEPQYLLSGYLDASK